MWQRPPIAITMTSGQSMKRGLWFKTCRTLTFLSQDPPKELRAECVLHTRLQERCEES